ncbi:MAG: nitrilase-related carbon-nitrogen hydrolase [Planctomycetota bacterium]
MHAHLFQYDIAWEDKAANHDRVRALAEEAGVAPGGVIVLPEMFDTGFSMRTELTAADPERSICFLSAFARERGCDVVASIAVPADVEGKCFNRAYVVGSDGVPTGHADKVHPFSYGRESERFVGGSTVGVFDAAGFTLCPIVCYDLRFPECFRAGVDGGAEVFAVIANWPAARVEHWRALCIARAIENQACVLGLNRCGSDPALTYPGASLVVDAMGVVVAEADDSETVLSVQVDTAALRSWREHFPALRDRKR